MFEVKFNFVPFVFIGLVFIGSKYAQAANLTPPSQTQLSPIQLSPIVVTSSAAAILSRPFGFTNEVNLTPNLKAIAPDTPALFTRTPGAAVVRNGAQSSFVQLNGLSGDRIRTLIDDMEITPAGPNAMDPSLSYIDPASVQSLTVFPTITPADLGGNVIGGTVLVSTPPPAFSDDGSLLFKGEVGANYDSAYRGRSLHGSASLGGADTAGTLSVERNLGGNQGFSGGTVNDTGYQLTNYRLGFAQKLAGGVLSASLWRHQVSDAGTPDLPMDMIRTDADIYSIGYTGSAGFGSYKIKLYRHWTDHLMDNFSLRPLGKMRMEVSAMDNEHGGTFSTKVNAGANTYRFGALYHDLTENAYQLNATNSMRQDLFVNARRKRIGAFASWAHDFHSAWHTQIGLRTDIVQSDADNIQNHFATTPAQDQQTFNQADKSFNNTEWGATALADYKANSQLTWNFSLARQVQAPSILERYLWTASGANAGLADGRSYIGNLALRPEAANKLAIGLDWHGKNWSIHPGVFYNRVNDYIQGEASQYTPNPAVLKFVNIGSATLCGFDTKWAGSVYGDFLWGLDGNISYVYGKDDDNGEYLYRLPPLRSYTEVYYQPGLWKLALGLEADARQNKVAAYNDEQPTPGYALLNFDVTYSPAQQLTLGFGIDNIFNRYYTPALNGINRVGGGDVPVDAKIPGPGRAVYAHVQYNFSLLPR
jgi:iron complex outermembrane receptor protein